ncbi:GATA transcription factor 12 [Rosa chinensis]|uniref:GATA transcription factor 12 n=1 Tax=Rosa chinensis TaxID=74649 RepID=UPI000D0916F6|nr:GATA transcription factor 12 [Rosa chinensis]
MEAPEYFQNSFCPQFVTEKQRHSFDNTKANNGAGAGDGFMVEDLLDFSNDDAVITDAAAAAFDNVTGNSTDSSTLTVIDSSCNSSSLSGCEPANFPADFGSRNFNEVPFSSDLCVPYDDLAELEWQLSSFSEESFSSEDLQKLQLISGMKARPDEAASETRHFQPDPNNHIISNHNNNNPIFNSDISVPAKARSKRSRAAPCNWTSRLLLLTPKESSPESSDVVISEPPSLPPVESSVGKKTLKAAPKKKENPEGGAALPGDGRKCLHCSTEKTPQWRTGPMGPKTLCNACGVRYKSGRLVPEYRPAASPTFVLTKHSNSHRKVLELRRQKEMVRAQHQYIHHQPPPHHHHHHNPNMIFDVNGGDYLIHQHVGPDFRQLI